MTPHPAPAARPRRALVAGAALVTALGVAGAAALPALREDRDAAAASGVRDQLERVVRAQDAWRAEHGAYTAQLADLGGVEGDADVAIVRAGTDSLCVGAYDGRTRTSLFYSVPGGLSARTCGGDAPHG